ncbi:MAG: hypothetical protein JNK15_26075 [Planctomycetes bacterium]|nr:hypothetical protein [Planctomycetota bacterium]
MQVIDLFRETETVDELGFAPIRDAFADHFFPGTSTIQTRARYFLFVPWLILQDERRKLPAAERTAKLRQRETQLIHALLAGGADQSGVIGSQSLGRLKRMPSSVYWRGLRLWGIRRFDGSLEQYFRRLAKGERPEATLCTDDGEPLADVGPAWDADLPERPANLDETVRLELQADEAEFLRDRILTAQGRSVMARLVDSGRPAIEAPHIWDPSIEPHVLRAQWSEIEHARCFALCAWGGPLVYERCVARMKTGTDELLAALEERLVEWREALMSTRSALLAWDHATFWALVRRLNPRLATRTQDFAKRWIVVAMRAVAGEAVWQDPQVEALVAARERQLKGGRARLLPENLRARDRWVGNAGIGPLDYRWGRTSVIVNDILQGLASASGAGARDA